MVATQPTGIGSIPLEIRDQIIRWIPLADMPNAILSSRAFHKQANAHLYRSVYHLIGSTQPDRYKFPLLRSPTVAHYPECSARITRLPKFLRTISECPTLLSYIDEASFSVSGSADEGEVEVLRRCLSLLSPSTLHLALPNNNADLALASAVTSLDVEYPAEKDLESLQDSLRDHVYSIFSIPSLRHLSLRCARSWNAFGPILDNTRVRTSNVVSLFLPETVPMDGDLQEILTWPKGLKSIYHDNEVGERKFFYTIYNNRAARIASPARFLEGIASQRDSLEELSYNDEEDRRGSDGSTFTSELISQFTKLRTISVPWSCLMGNDEHMHPLYKVLPPNLEELYLCYGMNVGDNEEEAELREWLQDVLDHKEERIPSLKAIVLWQWDDQFRTLSYCSMEDHVRDHHNLELTTALFQRLSLGHVLKKTVVRLEFIHRPPSGMWDSNMWR